MLKLAKNIQLLQTIAVRCIASLHPFIEHNIGKAQALKEAFFHCYIEAIPGDYLEFGVYEGTSLISAFYNNRKYVTNKQLPKRCFWGWDSFDNGFKYFDNKDKHPFFQEGDFTSSYQKTKQRLSKTLKNKATWHLIKGYFEDTLTNTSAIDMGINKAAVVLIDCDLGSPAKLALKFIAPILQLGTVVILDDYFSYKGSATKGVAGAFLEFKQQHPNIIFRRLCDYSHGGRAFVVSSI